MLTSLRHGEQGQLHAAADVGAQVRGTYTLSSLFEAAVRETECAAGDMSGNDRLVLNVLGTPSRLRKDDAALRGRDLDHPVLPTTISPVFRSID